MDRWKSRGGRVREEKNRREKIRERERDRRKKMQVREKVGKSRNTVFFEWFVAPEGPKSRLAKAGARWEMKSARQGGAKHIGSQNVQNTPFSDHFWKLRCRKSARCSGAKHMWKSKCTNTSCSDDFWKLRCQKSARRYTALHYTTLHKATLITTTTTLHYS